MMYLKRVLLLIMALVIGGGLGYKLLPGFEPLKMILFFMGCGILGRVFCLIDRELFKK